MLLKKFSKTICAVMAIMILSLSLSVPSFAYSFQTGNKRQSTPAVFYVASNADSRYVTDFQAAMTAWNNAGFGTLLQYGGRRAVITVINDGYNCVSVGNRGNTQAVGVTSILYNSTTKIIVETDIDINTYHNQKFSTDSVLVSGYDVQSVFTHELGHALGLGDEYSQTEATMYAYINPNETKKRSLHSDDINGLRALGY